MVYIWNIKAIEKLKLRTPVISKKMSGDEGVCIFYQVISL